MKTTRLSFFPCLNFSSLFSRLPLSYLLLTSLTLLFATAAQAQVPSYVPTNGLVGYWPFNGNANDESGNGNNGSFTGSSCNVCGTNQVTAPPATAEDRFNYVNSAFEYDNELDFISVPNSSTLQLTNEYTIATWLNPSSLDLGNFDFGVILAKWGNTGVASYQIRMSSDGNIIYDTQDGSATTTLLSSSSLSLNQWTHVLITQQLNSVSIFINGSLDSQSSSMNTPIVSNSTVEIGRNYNQFSDYPFEGFIGKIDDIGIWNRALTADEVLALYNGCNVVPQVVAGSSNASAFENSTYTCNNNAGSTYTWTVNNGVIVNGQGTDSVTILWGAEGAGSVTVVETTADGCFGDPVSLDVNVQCVASGNAIEGFVVVVEYSNSIYTCNGAANSSYQWTVTNGIIESGQGTNSVTILWASAGAGNIGVVETTYEGCVGTTLSQDIVVAPGVNIEEFSNAILLFPNPATTELNLQTTSDLIGTDVFVFDALGKQILKQQILSTNTIINTSSFAVGNYVVKVGGGVKKFDVEK